MDDLCEKVGTEKLRKSTDKKLNIVVLILKEIMKETLRVILVLFVKDFLYIQQIDSLH